MPFGTLNADTITNSNGLSGNAIGPGFKNRIINGDMRIDQRNAGAAVTHSGSSNLYVLDRWVCNSTGTPQFSVQRVADAPAGFINSSKLTTTTSGTPSASDFSYYVQYIEGFNIADLGFGTASAKTVTISFWTKSSLTGTFGGAIANSAVNRCYPFSYSISSANTWEYKTITIPGDTTGTWLTDSGRGITIYFDTGAGTTYKGTAGSWTSSAIQGVTGGVNLVATASATWYITGVQFEVAPSATSFDYRPFGTELALCQRYCQVISRSVGSLSIGGIGTKQGGIYLTTQLNYQTMRSSPTWANAPTGWDTSGTPSATQAYAFDFLNNNYVTITGAFSIINQLNTNAGRIYFVAGTSFSGASAGSCFALGLGADPIFTSEL